MTDHGWRKMLRAIFFLTGVSVLAGCLDKPHNASYLSLLSSYTSAKNNVSILLSNVDLGKIVDNLTFGALIETKLKTGLNADKEWINEAETIQDAVSQAAVKRVDIEKRLTTAHNDISLGLKEGLTSMAVGGRPLKKLPETKHAPALVQPLVGHDGLLPLFPEKRSKYLTQGELQMANTFSVFDSEGLMSALARAKGGDTIELAGGDYGDFSLTDGRTDFNVKFESEVKIRSSDSDNPASFSGMNLRGVSNLTFDGVTFDYEFSAGDPVYIQPFGIGDSIDHITIKNSVFVGDRASDESAQVDGFGYGMGLSVRDASNISIDNNEFFDWHRGARFADVENLLVTGNDVHSVRSDGFNFIEVRSALIENNYIHDFSAPAGSTDHRDMIQFWTNRTDTPTTDVVIRGNVLDIGEGAWAQSIFMRNEEVDMGRAGEEMYYQNILIENNTIYNGHTHGITVGEADGLIIQGNSVLQAQGGLNDLSGGVSVPKISVKTDSKSVTIKGNITSDVNGHEGQPGWSVSGNAIIAPEQYADHFIASSLYAQDGKHGFIALPDGLIETMVAGSDGTLFPEAPDTVTPMIQVYADQTTENALVFDASLTVGPVGRVLEDGAQFVWTFEDSSTAEGPIVRHSFDTPGYQSATLQVISRDGSVIETQVPVGIAGDEMVKFDPLSGQFNALGYGEADALKMDGAAIMQSAGAYALKLGGEGSQASIASSELEPFFGTDAFELSMSLKADGGNSWGEIARIHTSFTASVDRSGNFTMELMLEDGTRNSIVSQGVDLTDGDRHDITFRFDGEAGFAEILIDGLVVAANEVFGELGGGPRSLNFGNPWNKQNFEGELSAFSLSTDTLELPAYEGSMSAVTDAVMAPDFVAPAPVPPLEAETDKPIPAANDTVPDAGDTLPGDEDSGALSPPISPMLFGGYKLNIADIGDNKTMRLYDDAHVTEGAAGPALSLDGKDDYLRIGRLTDFEGSERIAFSVDFSTDGADGGSQRLVWNHTKLGLTVQGDSIKVRAANKDSHISDGFEVEGLRLSDGARHSATVMVDEKMDRLQLVVDGELILDERSTDFDFTGGRESGWTLGTAWNRWFDGEVYDFQVSDDFAFVEPSVEDGTLLG